MEPIRERVEDFMRRYWRVLAVAAALVLARLVRRWLLGVAVPAAIGAILMVSGWLLLAPAGEQSSVDRYNVGSDNVVWPCVRNVPGEDRVFVDGTRKDCGIVGPQAEVERDVRPYDGPY